MIDSRNDSLPERAVGQIRYEIDADACAVTILECRPTWREDFGPEWSPFPVARLRHGLQWSSRYPQDAFPRKRFSTLSQRSRTGGHRGGSAVCQGQTVAERPFNRGAKHASHQRKWSAPGGIRTRAAGLKALLAETV